MTRASPEYFPLLLGRVILGGGSSSRMFVNIREKEGFAYDAHAEQNTHKDGAQLRGRDAGSQRSHRARA